MADFGSALDYTLANEGGFVDDPNDSGGATNFGITQATASAYGYDGDMREIPMDLVATIYRDGYWDSWNLGSIPTQGIATAIFDLHVNMGGGAAKVVQAAMRALGWTGAADGAWGPQTLAGVLASDPAALLAQIAAAAGQRYRNIAAANPKNAGFLNGWLNRAEALGQLGLDAVTEAIGENPGKSATGAVLICAAVALLALKRGRA
jgi:type VI secretion system secreted protein VgrG